jgi:hypothetical protein
VFCFQSTFRLIFPSILRMPRFLNGLILKGMLARAGRKNSQLPIDSAGPGSLKRKELAGIRFPALALAWPGAAKLQTRADPPLFYFVAENGLRAARRLSRTPALLLVSSMLMII